MRKLAISFMAIIICMTARGQNSFSLGAKIGYGTSAFPMNVLIESNGITSLAKSGATLSTGVIGRYMIGSRMGIESGLSVNHYSYYRSQDFRRRQAIWKSAAEFEILNYQMPVILNYQIQLPRHPSRYLTFGAGTSIDWCISYLHEGLSYSVGPLASKNIIGSIKTGSERPKGNKIEIGIEVQYTLREFEIAHYTDHGYEYKAYSRLNMVALHVCYFFLKKERHHTSV